MDEQLRKRLDAFLLAVRALEHRHGLYLETSEWLMVVDKVPSPDTGVFAAADTVEKSADLHAQSELQRMTGPTVL